MVWRRNQNQRLTLRDRFHDRLMPGSGNDHIRALEGLPIQLLGHPLVNSKIPDFFSAEGAIRVTATQNQLVVPRKLFQNFCQLTDKILPVARRSTDAREDQRPNSTTIPDLTGSLHFGWRQGSNQTNLSPDSGRDCKIVSRDRVRRFEIGNNDQVAYPPC